MGPIMHLETTPDMLSTFAMVLTRNFKNLVPDLEDCCVFQNLKDASRLLSNNSSSLLEYVDNNNAEHFNHAVAKFVVSTLLQEEAMKQDATVLLCNIIPAAMAQYKLHKIMFDTSPGMSSKACQINRNRKVNLGRERRTKDQTNKM
ncbi:hypothetical protein PR048_005557 [Dryococelus australis]|uniref:Uncharacterized protein n=1 Tax=Dryococelus australis TaxID=614101 RepID=A0ABQ9I8K3_9NEOP|nr:hypothetical protein PR048_005557 [Dryococelus australis]